MGRMPALFRERRNRVRYLCARVAMRDRVGPRREVATLMPTPLKGYYLNGTRIPSTSTIIGRFKDSSGLMPWAFNQGMKRGLAGEATAKLYDDTSAVDIGTAAHAMVEARIKNPDANVDLIGAGLLPDPALFQKAKSAVSAYEAWANNFKVEIVAQEIQLVST